MLEQPTTSSQSVNTAATVNAILAAHPAAVAVFNAFGIDACCGGDASLSEAAHRDGANLDALVAALDAVILRQEAP
jgi:iron-sulfur cluster repair protein YtfE (RIC family)